MAKESIAALRRRIAELKGAGRELSAQELDEIPALYRRIGEIGAERRTAYERGRVPLFADQIPETEPIDYPRRPVKDGIALEVRTLRNMRRAFGATDTARRSMLTLTGFRFRSMRPSIHWNWTRGRTGFSRAEYVHV